VLGYSPNSSTVPHIVTYDKKFFESSPSCCRSTVLVMKQKGTVTNEPTAIKWETVQRKSIHTLNIRMYYGNKHTPLQQ
jgi:hypothetical protein